MRRLMNGPPEGGSRVADVRLVAAACIVATVAFWAYTRTLLPGVDLGDTGSLQAAVLWPEQSARRAHPLYYRLATPFIRAVSEERPARGLNLFSAIWAAVAAGLLALVTGRLTRSPLAGAAAGLLLAFAYTFWTQAVIAEVHSLHLALLALCLIALQAFAASPTTARLAAFFVVYAVSFGNHVGMILFLAPFAVFLLQVHPRPRELFLPTTILLAIVIAAAGALQYAPQFLHAWSSIDAPASWSDRITAFWQDVTKAGGRDQMLPGITSDRIGDRVRMWAWDARQQFGIAGLVLATIGLARLWTLSRAWAVLVGFASLCSMLFALTSKVGDTHVLFLPGHLFVAFAIAAGAAAWRSARIRRAMGVAVLIYAVWRGWDTWPAADRHADRRAQAFVSRLTGGVDAERALLVAKLDWQMENALLYSARYERSGLSWVRLDAVLMHFPLLVRDTISQSRDVVLNTSAAKGVAAAYGNSFAFVPDQPPAQDFGGVASRIPRGSPYVLMVLLPAPSGLARAR